jgi:hypothetical protein
MSAITWKDVEGNAALQAGKTYRIHTYVKAAYTPANVELLKKLYRLKLAGPFNQIMRFEHAAPMYSAHGTGQNPFPFHVVFLRKGADPNAIAQAGIDPRGLMAIAALVVVAAASFYLISSKLQILVETVAEEVRDTVSNFGDNLNKTVLNPGLLLLGFGAFYLWTRKGN